jgi:glucose/arabinose dehydrogenase
MLSRPVAALATVLVLAAAACQPTLPRIPSPAPVTLAPGQTERPTNPPSQMNFAIALERFAEVPGGPLAIAAPDDGTDRLFVAAQAGQIWSVDAEGALQPDPMIDLSDRLRSGGEQGLLGLATHPDFATDPRVFVNFTDLNGDTVIASLTVEQDDPSHFDPASFRQLLFIDQPYANHNGGGVAFGPDGYLYLALGDGGSGGDPHDNGQRLDTLLGKILRIDIDADGQDYGIPEDNPFANADGMDEIWHFGLRNPWRFSFDRETGDLWIGDVGQGAWEEIDVARDGEGGLNFGWNVMEGAHCYQSEACPEDGLTLPVTEFGRDLGSVVIGGYVYRGEAFPVLEGAYLFANFGGPIFAIDGATSTLVAPAPVGQVDGSIAAFGEDTDGELYAASLGGTIYRVTAMER